MSDSKATIVFKAKDQLMPLTFIEKVLAAGMTAVGYGFRLGQEKSLSVEIGDGDNTATNINDMQESFKEEEIFIAFMDPKQFKHKEDYLPIKMFVDKEKEERTVLIGFADGKFTNFIPSGSDHSNEYFLFNKYLIPKLSKLRQPDHDIGQLMNELADPLLKQDIDNLTANGGTLVMLAANGMHVMSAKNEDMKMFAWGWTSNPHGYEEKVEAEPSVVGKVGGWLAKKKEALAGKSPIIATKTDAKPEPARTEQVTHPVDVATEYVEIRVPESIWNSNKAVKNYLQNKLGYLPKNWRDFKSEVWTVKKKKQPTIVKDFKEIPKEVMAAAADVASKLSKEVTDRFIRVIPPKVLEAIKEDLENLDKNSQAILDPEIIQAFEDAHPSFWEQTGKSKDFTDNMTDEQILHLCVKYPVAAAILLLNYRADEIVSRPDDYRGADAGDPDTSGTGSTKPENKWLAKKKERIAM